MQAKKWELYTKVPERGCGKCLIEILVFQFLRFTWIGVVNAFIAISKDALTRRSDSRPALFG